MQEEFPALVRRLLAALGEDPDREGLRHTPERVERALRFLTAGYQKDPAKVINSACYSLAYDEMVIVKDIEFFSLCEHHLLPFFGRCHIAYIPKQKVVGLSKLPRLVNVFAHRLQLQERLTNQIARTLWEQLEPKGVGVIVEARHFCMMMRGVEKKGSVTVTSSMLGLFRDNDRTRHEFLSLVQSDRKS
ncbi:MAG TPA: GTP cyclohydrolase I FolE [Candidatus Xenobia bacterium]|nr:GTP cyclohydrolase I FolE [Candidatus Xenobia bacterium]